EEDCRRMPAARLEGRRGLNAERLRRAAPPGIFTAGGLAMDFADSPEHAAFRKELRGWLDANLTDDLKVEDAQDQRVSPDRETLERRRAWQKKMLAAGWVGLSWPKEYGGCGASFMQQVIFDEE